jgi:predicted dehydrogenase
MKDSKPNPNRSSYDQGISRRRFIAAAGAALAMPAFIPGRALGLNGETAPSNRVTMGIIGCGNQGTNNTHSFLAQKDCQIVATCDVDKNHLNHTTGIINKKYGNQDCKPYHDFRELLARPDIDTVMIAVPDHWHAIPAIEAAQAKKDIYGEKPLAHTIAEQQAIVRAVHENGRIWQTGSWQRSEANFHFAAEIVRNGLIGHVTEIEVGLPAGNKNSGNAATNMTPSDPPPELDYERWIGPAAMMPYIQGRVHRNWRWNYNTGGGQLMDWIGHHCDIAHWGMGWDDSGPSEIEGHGDFPPRDAVWNAATTYRIVLQYPGEVTMTIAGGYPDIRSGTKWIGTEGWVHVDRGEFSSSHEQWEQMKRLPEGLRRVKLYESHNHFKNFLDCVKSRTPTITPAETAHHSAIPGHLGYISMVVNRKLKWDAQSEQIVDDSVASLLLKRPYRTPWTLA